MEAESGKIILNEIEGGRERERDTDDEKDVKTINKIRAFVGRRMEKNHLYYFVHKSHPLTLQLVEHPNSERCSGCDLPLRETSYYGCITCSVYFHKFCLELPPKIRHWVYESVFAKAHHYLVLNYNGAAEVLESRTAFRYVCDTCDFATSIPELVSKTEGHILTLTPYPTEVTKRFHDFFNSRWLRRAICFICNEALHSLGFFYCEICELYLHVGCALPPTFKSVHHRHLLKLSDSADDHFCSTSTDDDDDFYCNHCEELLHPGLAVYKCPEIDCSGFVAHCYCEFLQGGVSICHVPDYVEMGIERVVMVKYPVVTVQEEELKWFQDLKTLNDDVRVEGDEKVKKLFEEEDFVGRRAFAKFMVNNKYRNRYIDILSEERPWSLGEVEEVGGYLVAKELAPILKGLFKRYGDFSAESKLPPKAKLLVFNDLCYAISQICTSTQIDDENLHLLLNSLKIAACARFEIQFAVERFKKAFLAAHGRFDYVDEKSVVSSDNEDLDSVDEKSVVSSDNEDLDSVDEKSVVSSDNDDLDSVDEKFVVSSDNEDLDSVDEKFVVSSDNEDLDSVDEKSVVSSDNDDLDSVDKKSVVSSDNDELDSVDDQAMDELDRDIRRIMKEEVGQLSKSYVSYSGSRLDVRIMPLSTNPEGEPTVQVLEICFNCINAWFECLNSWFKYLKSLKSKSFREKEETSVPGIINTMLLWDYKSVMNNINRFIEQHCMTTNVDIKSTTNFEVCCYGCELRTYNKGASYHRCTRSTCRYSNCIRQTNLPRYGMDTIKHIEFNIPCNHDVTHFQEPPSDYGLDTIYINYIASTERTMESSLDRESVEECCFVCGLPLWGTSYGCKKHGSLHKHCVQIPLEIQHFLHPLHPLVLRPNSEIRNQGCYVCGEDCRGCAFSCSDCSFFVEVQCVFRKETFKCESHEHLLTVVEAETGNWGRRLYCPTCKMTIEQSFYLYCGLCNFSYHAKCVLPSTITSSHRHPLTVVESHKPDDSNEFYCTACEERIKPEHPVYYCFECFEGNNHTAHIVCALSEMKPNDLPEELNIEKYLSDPISNEALITSDLNKCFYYEGKVQSVRREQNIPRTTSGGFTDKHGDQKGEDVDVDEILDKDVDEDALITNRSRARTTTMGTHENEEDFEEKRKKEEEEERKKKKGKAPLLDEDEEY